METGYFVENNNFILLLCLGTCGGYVSFNTIFDMSSSDWQDVQLKSHFISKNIYERSLLQKCLENVLHLRFFTSHF